MKKLKICPARAVDPSTCGYVNGDDTSHAVHFTSDLGDLLHLTQTFIDKLWCCHLPDTAGTNGTHFLYI